jgi:hypothetical protein
VQFRPRAPAPSDRSRPFAVQERPKDEGSEPYDLSRYERERAEPDDFRHRILANMAALAFTLALTAVGIWLAVSITDLRKTRDCELIGRHDCGRFSRPSM